MNFGLCAPISTVAAREVQRIIWDAPVVPIIAKAVISEQMAVGSWRPTVQISSRRVDLPGDR